MGGWGNEESFSDCALWLNVRVARLKTIIKTLTVVECRNFTVDSSAPSNLLPQVRITSTTPMLFSIYIWIVSCGKDENKRKRGRDWPIFGKTCTLFFFRNGLTDGQKMLEVKMIHLPAFRPACSSTWRSRTTTRSSQWGAGPCSSKSDCKCQMNLIKTSVPATIPVHRLNWALWSSLRPHRKSFYRLLLKYFHICYRTGTRSYWRIN